MTLRSAQSPTKPLTAIFWMVVTGLLFVCVTALVKLLGTDLPAAQSAFIRYVLGLTFLLPMAPSLMRLRLTGRQYGLFALRGLVHSLGVALWFFAMARIPIADVTAMNYMSPIYITLGAAMFLGERLHFRRILAVLVALIGAFIILRPGMRDLGAGHFAMIFTALMFGASYLLAKQLSGEVSAAIVVAMLSVFVTVGLAPLALTNWVPPTWPQIGVLFLVASAATAGHYTMTLAFAAGPMTVTQPVTFLQLVWAVLLGYFVFGEGIDIWVIVGGALILASVVFISWREALLKQRRA